jgi:hypothetical protein
LIKSACAAAIRKGLEHKVRDQYGCQSSMAYKEQDYFHCEVKPENGNADRKEGIENYQEQYAEKYNLHE